MSYDKRRAIYVAHKLNRLAAARGMIGKSKERFVEQFRKEYDNMNPEERDRIDKEYELP